MGSKCLHSLNDCVRFLLVCRVVACDGVSFLLWKAAGLAASLVGPWPIQE